MAFVYPKVVRPNGPPEKRIHRREVKSRFPCQAFSAIQLVVKH